jgi:DNA-directed RNA polymerase sigma subunit (sigma70/sigma32)
LDKPIDESNPGDGTLGDLISKTEESEATDHPLYLQSFKKEIARALGTLTQRESDVIKFYF